MAFTPLNALNEFLAVARRRSFAGAASELGISPSALSQAVRQLEAKLGVTLLSRTTRSVALTAAGRRLFEQAGPAMSQALEAIKAASARAGELTGQIRLTVPALAVPFVINPVLPRFVALHPKVEVEVQVDNRLIDIVAEGFDAGVRRGARARTGSRSIAVESPWIARHAMQARQPRGEHAVVGHGRLAEDHAARFAQPRRRRRIRRSRHQLGGDGTTRHRHALGGDIVLDRRWHAVQRADRLAVPPAFGRRLCGGAGAFGIERVQRLDVRLPRRDMRQHVLQHFGRRKLPGPKARDQVDGAEIVQRRDRFVRCCLMHGRQPEGGFR